MNSKKRQEETKEEKRIKREKQEKVAEYCEKNLRLAYYITRKYYVNYSDIIEDIEGAALYGLAKAAMNFDEKKGFQFSTYAGNCIENEIRIFLRKSKGDIKNVVVSLDEPIGQEEKIIFMDLISNLQYPSTDELIAKRDEVTQVLNHILNRFLIRKIIVIFYSLGGMQQKEIASILGLSQSYISRMIRQTFNKLKVKIKIPISEYRRAKVTWEDDTYQMTIFFREYTAEKFEKVKLAVKEEGLKSKLRINGNCFELQISFFLEEADFISLANLFRKLEDFLRSDEENGFL